MYNRLPTHNPTDKGKNMKYNIKYKDRELKKTNHSDHSDTCGLHGIL